MYDPVDEILVLITYTSREGSDETAQKPFLLAQVKTSFRLLGVRV